MIYGICAEAATDRIFYKKSCYCLYDIASRLWYHCKESTCTLVRFVTTYKSLIILTEEEVAANIYSLYFH